jgi:mannose-1-phosphate guanylyltransferase/mannose-6-phosphate isomerase
MNSYAIILCGGSGTRFWPLSRLRLPKQFLNICSDDPLVADTIGRILPIVKRQNIYIATGKIHGPAIKGCLRRFGIPAQNFLLEPEGKNTLSPIAVLTDRIYSRDTEAVIAVLPSDHFIRAVGIFRKLLKRGMAIAGNGFIVTLGIVPHRPETGYGYIKAAARRQPCLSGRQAPAGNRYYKVAEFIEKPSLARAKSFIKSKRYYWNSGAFIFRADTVRGEIKRFAPGVFRIITAMRKRKRFDSLWRRLPFISFDCAVMEKTDKAVVCPADYGWTDVGSWEALAEVIKPDGNANIFKGQCLDLGSRSTLVWSGKRLVATVGLSNIIIVDTPDAVLVCSRDKAQDVRKVVELLKQKKLRALL